MTEKRSIVDIISGYLEEGVCSVPVFHTVALRLQQLLSRPDYSIDEVNRLITADAGLAGQVLAGSNSSFYAGLTKVTTIRDAIVRLGASSVANIVMFSTQKDMYRSADAKLNEIMRTLWQHALCCAIGARWLAGSANLKALADEAFLAGLLHDVGKLHLLKVTEEIVKAGKTGALSPALISEVINSMHTEHGHHLMVKWNMPEIYCNVVRCHHADEWRRGDLLLALVRLADQTCNKLEIGMRPDPNLVLFASEEAQLLGVKEITLAELEIVIEDAARMALPKAA